MKRVKIPLSAWIRAADGNVFQQIAIMEYVIKVKEIQLKIQPHASNQAELSKVDAELKNFL